MPAPICLSCGLSMRCQRNGQPVLICSDPDKEKPYQLYYTDAYSCQGCGAVVASGFSEPTEHFEDTFQRELDAAGDHLVRAF